MFGRGRSAQAPLPREIWVLVTASFVIALGFGIVAPALPAFATSFDVGVTAAAAVISAFAFMRLAFAPVSGRLVQRFGERPIYLTGLVVVAVSTGSCAFAQSYWQLLVFRGLGGVGSTMFTVSAGALLVRLAPADVRGRVTGLFATGFLLGNIGGPILGGLLVGLGLRAPFLLYAAALLLAAAVVHVNLRHSVLVDVDTTDDRPVLALRDVLANPSYRAALTSSFANGWAVFGVRVSLVPLFVVEVLGSDASLAGIALSVFAAGNAAVLLTAGRLSDVHGRKPLILAGLVVTGIGTAWVGFTASTPTFLLASLVAGVGAGLINPPQQAVVADVVGSRARGGPALAGFQMAADVGAILGPLLAGLLAQNVSYPVAFAVTGALSLVAAGVWARSPETLPARAPAGAPAVLQTTDAVISPPEQPRSPARPGTSPRRR